MAWHLYWLQNGKSFFQLLYEVNQRPTGLKSWDFEASENTMTKFKSQALHILRIKY